MIKFAYKGCDRRTAGCHTTCSDYKRDRKRHEELISEYTKNKDTDNYRYGVTETRALKNALDRKNKRH